MSSYYFHKNEIITDDLAQFYKASLTRMLIILYGWTTQKLYDNRTKFLESCHFRYGPIFRTNLIGEDLIVSLDQDLNNLVFQKEEKLFQIWYPESLMRIMGADCIIATLGTFHKHLRTLVLRLFGPENLRMVLLHEIQQTAQANLLSWLDHPSIEVKEATSSVCPPIPSPILMVFCYKLNNLIN